MINNILLNSVVNRYINNIKIQHSNILINLIWNILNIANVLVSILYSIK